MISTETETNLTRPPHHLRLSLQRLVAEPPFVALIITSSLSILLLYLVLFLQSSTFEVLFLSSTAPYLVATIVLTPLIALLGGIGVTQAVYILSNRLAARRGQGVARGIAGAGFGALAAGCPSCASLLLPLLGIAGSLAAYPLGGLELRLFALIVLADALWENSRVVAGVCPTFQTVFARMEDDALVLNFNDVVRQLKPALLIVFFVLMVYILPFVPAEYRVSFTTENAQAAAVAPGSGGPASADVEAVLAQINPAEGYALDYTYGDIGPQLIEAGAIDQEAFAQVYVDGGSPLTEDELRILNQGGDEPIVITRQNAHFLLNLFWALGLANQNVILDEGPLMQNSGGSITTFASTGGWTLSSKPVEQVYSSVEIISLTPEQQALVEKAAAGTYRPCCGNSTLFADCNHGMAMLGLFELIASQGATLDEMFQAAKYFNAFWFPQQTFDLALYFQATTGQEFTEVDAETLVSGNYSSGQGWRGVRQWLSQNGQIQQVPGGGGCGV